MIVEKIYCDLCGKEIDYKGLIIGKWRHHKWEIHDSVYRDYYEVCEECDKEIIDKIKELKKKKK